MHSIHRSMYCSVVLHYTCTAGCRPAHSKYCACVFNALGKTLCACSQKYTLTKHHETILQSGRAFWRAARLSSLCFIPGVSLSSSVCKLCKQWRERRPLCVIDGHSLSCSSCRVSLTVARWTRPSSLRYLQREKSRVCNCSRSTGARGIFIMWPDLSQKSVIIYTHYIMQWACPGHCQWCSKNNLHTCIPLIK